MYCNIRKITFASWHITVTNNISSVIFSNFSKKFWRWLAETLQIFVRCYIIKEERGRGGRRKWRRQEEEKKGDKREKREKRKRKN